MSKFTGEWDDSLSLGEPMGYHPGPSISKGSRLKIVREGEPDVYVIVDDVKRTGNAVTLDVHPEEERRAELPTAALILADLDWYLGMTPGYHADALRRAAERRAATPCHPYDEACGGPGGPCRNHGGMVAPGSTNA